MRPWANLLVEARFPRPISRCFFYALRLPPPSHNAGQIFGGRFFEYGISGSSYASFARARLYTTTTKSALQPNQPAKNNDYANVLLSLSACSGCGASVQTVFAGNAGYFSLSRSAVRQWIRHRLKGSVSTASFENCVGIKSIIDGHGTEEHGRLQQSPFTQLHREYKEQSQNTVQIKTPVCDRCHQLLHHRSGASIHHPSMHSIAATIAVSPFKYNHVYHLIDAADFPLSLVPNIHALLSSAPLRSRNRRSKNDYFHRGKKTEISFIITKSDLLAPKKEQVDALMPYLVEVLRSALGTSGKNVRLGNVRCVSAKRGWWTKTVKEELSRRGGGAWMVGKVNVGKSNFFEAVFPKGQPREAYYQDRDAFTLETQPERDMTVGPDLEDAGHREGEIHGDMLDDRLNKSFLLPPARTETAFPDMPTISSLPGTTASPIRIPFGGGKGELIDLPGLARGDLESFVQREHRGDLVMNTRVVPKQYVIKPGQSLILGGLFRITPEDPNATVLAYPFVSLKPHVTSTEKAIAYQNGQRSLGLPSFAIEGAAAAMKSAGTFLLSWDVTKQRAGPLTTRSVLNLKAHNLPFQVLSVDLLIEGCGWVELVAQVRKSVRVASSSDDTPQRLDISQDATELKIQDSLDPLLPQTSRIRFAESNSSRGANVVSEVEQRTPLYKHETTRSELDNDSLEPRADQRDPSSKFPSIEVFSPGGHFVGFRQPMGAWILGAKQSHSVSRRKVRPRKSMRSLKGSSIRYADKDRK